MGLVRSLVSFFEMLSSFRELLLIRNRPNREIPAEPDLKMGFGLLNRTEP